MNLLYLGVFTLSLEVCLSARILGVFPVPSISHQVVFRALTLELAKRGHELYIITPDPAYPKDQPHPNVTEVDTHDVAYAYWQKQLVALSKRAPGAKTPTIDQYEEQQLNQCIDMFEFTMQAPEVQAMLKNETEHFDLILIETFIRAAHAFRHRFKAPLIGLSSFSSLAVTFDAVGAPTHPVIYPDYFIENWINPGLLDRINMLHMYLRQAMHELYVGPKLNEVARKYFGEDTPDVKELESQMDMMFLNVNPIWDGIRPTPPSVIYIGGIHVGKPPQKLPQDLKSFLDASERGVVYMSLGSNVRSSSLGADQLHVFLETFRRLPYDVLWKWETDQLPGKPGNVKISKWLPQADLLRHPNVKVFIMQGGLQSIDEALQAGVPMIGFPFFGDQDYNVAKFDIYGVGKALKIDTVTADVLEATVKEVAENNKYRENMRRMGRLLADQAQSGLERAVWWTEHVLRHGGASHLRSPAVGVTWIRYFMLDIAAALTLAVLVPLAVVCFIIRRLFKSLRAEKIKKH